MKFDKSQVAKHFSKAAKSYDHYAQLQRDIGDNLLNYLPVGTYHKGLDLGCGTGHFLAPLSQRTQLCFACDISPVMLATALGKSQNQQVVAGLCGDAEALPICNDRFDLVFSNLALQWCNNLQLALTEIKRCLKPKGICMISTLLDGTLRELRQAWQILDPNYQHVNRFLSRKQVEQAIADSGLRVLHLGQESVSLTYPKLLPLLHELKGIGANYVVGANKGLSTQRQLAALEAAYLQTSGADSGLVATYQVLYGVLIND